MTEFAFDMVFNTVIRVQASNLEEAVNYLRQQLDCWSPEFGIQLPVGGVDEVKSAVLTELSLGNHVAPDGRPVPALALFEVERESLGGGPVDLEGIRQPQVCRRWMEGQDLGGVECHEVYDDADNDGRAHDMCPACADAEEIEQG